MKSSSPVSSLPIRRNITPAYSFSLLIALLMGAASAVGLLFQNSIYPTEELSQTFVANDVVNLFIGLPILLGSLWLTRRGKLIGLLFWPGALFYVLYNYLVYLLATALNGAFLAYLALVLLSSYTIIRLLASFDRHAIHQRLTGIVPERLAGGVLLGFGVLFFLRSFAGLFTAFSHQTVLAPSELALNLTDLLITPTWVIGGFLLWRRRTIGYVAGLGLLFQASMLFIGLIIFMVLQPLMTSASFSLVNVLVIFVMGLVCFIPFGLFLRGVNKK